jgi:hypothetical protein
MMVEEGFTGLLRRTNIFLTPAVLRAILILCDAAYSGKWQVNSGLALFFLVYCGASKTMQGYSLKFSRPIA